MRDSSRGKLISAAPPAASRARAISDFGEEAREGFVTLAGLGGVACDAPVAAAFARAREAAGGAAEISLPRELSRIRFAGFIKVARWLGGRLAGAEPALLSVTLQHLLGYGLRRPQALWEEDRQVLAETAAALRHAVERHGHLLLPTAPHLPHPLSQAAPADQADFTCLANIAELPALSLPAGGSDDGLPVGVQLIGLPGREAGLFAAARMLDAQLAAYRRPSRFFEGE
jgi:aspartyl-tRNA(Asn)/glutamyl-tRNA(Gln) amidotransferase subunit A